jgi:hypothetical protein
MESHQDLLVKRVGVCDKFYLKNKINEEQLLSELFWVILLKDDNPLITYDFYCGNFWICLQCEININEFIYQEYNKIEKLN